MKPIFSAHWNKSLLRGERNSNTCCYLLWTAFEQVLFFKTNSPAVNFFLSPALPVRHFLLYKERCPLLPVTSFRVVEMQQVFLKNKVSNKPLGAGWSDHMHMELSARCGSKICKEKERSGFASWGCVWIQSKKPKSSRGLSAQWPSWLRQAGQLEGPTWGYCCLGSCLAGGSAGLVIQSGIRSSLPRAGGAELSCQYRPVQNCSGASDSPQGAPWGVTSWWLSP